jgi:hypothetical protein
MLPDPSGIKQDRGVIERFENDAAVVRVGPSQTPVHLPVTDLPHGAEVGSWLVLDLQIMPPLALRIVTDGAV